VGKKLPEIREATISSTGRKGGKLLDIESVAVPNTVSGYLYILTQSPNWYSFRSSALLLITVSINGKSLYLAISINGYQRLGTATTPSDKRRIWLGYGIDFRE